MFHFIVDDGSDLYTWGEYAEEDFNDAIEDFDDDDIVAIFNTKVGIVHRSEKSALYDDMTYYVDIIQESDKSLKDNIHYYVCYYEAEFGTLIFKCEKITKEQIIKNVKAQKYVEGATYFEENLDVDIDKLKNFYNSNHKESPQQYVSFGKDGDNFYVQLSDGKCLKENIVTRNEAMLWAAVEGIRLNLEVKEW